MLQARGGKSWFTSFLMALTAIPKFSICILYFVNNQFKQDYKEKNQYRNFTWFNSVLTFTGANGY